MAELTTAELRQQVLEAYGSVCSVCGEDDRELLQIDHIRGGGTRERKRLRGCRFYEKLIRGGCPPTIQILCLSCYANRTASSHHTSVSGLPVPGSHRRVRLP